jgi:hypothetical protein
MDATQCFTTLSSSPSPTSIPLLRLNVHQSVWFKGVSEPKFYADSDCSIRFSIHPFPVSQYLPPHHTLPILYTLFSGHTCDHPGSFWTKIAHASQCSSLFSFPGLEFLTISRILLESLHMRFTVFVLLLLLFEWFEEHSGS